MSEMDSPALRSALAVAGMGAVSMMTGSSAATTAVRMPRQGFQAMLARAQESVVTATAGRAVGDLRPAEPAVTTPSTLNGVGRAPSFSSDVSRSDTLVRPANIAVWVDLVVER
jgi:hypothetical protein